MTRRRWLVGGALVVVALGFAWAFLPKPIPVELAGAARGRFEQTIEEDGKTRVRERYVVSAPLAGKLERIRLDPGDAVEAGTLLASLFPAAPALLDVRTVRELEERVGAAAASLAQARAGTARAEVALAQVETDFARASKLAAEGFLSPAVREKAELDVRLQVKMLEATRFAQQGAEHNLAQARAALLRARDVPGGRSPAAAWQIVSPVKGRVLKLLQESEAVVAIGTPLLEIADPGDLEIVVDVLSADATRIPPGAVVHVDAGPTLQLSGRVRLIEPGAFTKVSALGVEEQRVNVIIDFTSAPEDWRALGDAYRVDVRIIVFARAEAVTVPVSALFREGSEWALFVAADSRARKRVVKLGGRTPIAAWIESGVAFGENVIVYPSDSVTDGARIQAVRGP